MHDSLATDHSQQAMTFIHPQLTVRHCDDTEERHNDMMPEALLLVGVSIAATFLSAGGDPSMVAIPGSMLAAFVALLKATQEKRAWTDKGIVVIGTSVVGTTLPSVAVHMIWPHWLEKLTWHVFLLSGFLSGLIGWMFAWAGILVLDARREKLASQAIDKMARHMGVIPTDREVPSPVKTGPLLP
jgi:hypothetical protein